MRKYKSSVDILIVFIFLTLSATYASFFGYISPDSWTYLKLTESIIDGKFCEINGSYFATFPCGYSFILSFFRLGELSWELISASKFTNAFLLFISFLLLRGMFTYRSRIFALLYILAPSTISISHFTWSENLFFLSTILTIYNISKIYSRNNFANMLFLVASLILGGSSRYIFGPFSFLILISSYYTYGHNFTRRILPSFIISWTILLLFYFYNISQTGFPTGMDRIPAPETFLYLLIKFLLVSIKEEILPLLLLTLIFHLFFVGLSRTNSISLKTFKESLKKSKSETMIFASGISYLVLSFILRTHTQYDIFGFRTIGYGIIFIFVSGYSLSLTHTKLNYYKIYKLVLFVALSFVIAKRGDLLTICTKLVNGQSIHKSINQQISDYDKSFRFNNIENIVSLKIPRISTYISGNSRYYYGADTKIITVDSAPYSNPETLSQFIHKIKNVKGACSVDFTTFNSKEEFVKYIKSDYDIDYIITFENGLFRLSTIKALAFNVELSNFLINYFEPNQTVNCEKLLSNV